MNLLAYISGLKQFKEQDGLEGLLLASASDFSQSMLLCKIFPWFFAVKISRVVFVCLFVCVSYSSYSIFMFRK